MILYFDSRKGLLCDEDGMHIAEQCDSASIDDMNSIVKAVNTHDELVSALEDLLAYEDDKPAAGTFGAGVYARAKTALKKAKGKTK